jgi:hypothetical protein
MTCLPTEETEVLIKTTLLFLWSKFTVFTEFGREVGGGFWSGGGSGGRSGWSGGTGAWGLLFLGSCSRGLALIILSFLGLSSRGFTSYLAVTFPIASIDSLG